MIGSASLAQKGASSEVVCYRLMDSFDDYVSFFSVEAKRWSHSEDISLGHRTDDYTIFTDLGGQCESDFF